MIPQGKNLALDTNTALPSMWETVQAFSQFLTFGVVRKQMVGFDVKETMKMVNFTGVVTPFGGRKLELLPEGQRYWNWLSVYEQCFHGRSCLLLRPDDTVMYRGKQYRVMTQQDYADYGYVYYELVEDYDHNGPEVVTCP